MAKNIIIVIVVIAILFTLIKLGVSNGNQVKKTLKPLEDIPEEYQNYQPISDSFKTDKHELVGFKTGKYKRTEIVHFNSSDSTLVVMGSNYGGETQKFPDLLIHTYHKLSAQGILIDSIQLSGDNIALTRGGYLIGQNYHCSWMLDGDTSKKPYKFFKDSVHLNIKDNIDSFQKLYTTATLAVYEEHYLERKQHMSIKLLNDSVWTKLQQPGLFEHEFRFETYPEKPIVIYDKNPTTKPSEVASFQHSHLPNLAEAGDIYRGENSHLRMVDYRKIRFIESKSNGAFNPNSMTYPAKWDGEGFMQLLYKGDIIPFKIVLNKMKRKEDGYEREYGKPLRFYTNEQLDFGILSENYGDLFLIKKQ